MDFEWKQRILFMFVVAIPVVVSNVVPVAPPQGLIWSSNPAKVKILRDFHASLRRGRENNGNADESLPVCKNEPVDAIFAENFDSRKHWIACPSLWEIRDQGSCNSWSSAVASVLTDRFCIATNGEKSQFRISSHDLLSCSSRFGVNATQNNNVDIEAPCQGIDFNQLWKNLENNGVSTGGYYGSNDGCKPTVIQPCDRSDSENWSCSYRPPANILKCENECLNPLFNGDYSADKKKIEGACRIPSGDEEGIKEEIFHNGPVLALIPLYDSLIKFKPIDSNEIYSVQNVTAEVEWSDNHLVKIVGWGTSKNGEKHWIVANSWDYYWADAGFFKLPRGDNSDFATLVTKMITAPKPFIQDEQSVDHVEEVGHGIFRYFGHIFG